MKVNLFARVRALLFLSFFFLLSESQAKTSWISWLQGSPKQVATSETSTTDPSPEVQNLATYVRPLFLDPVARYSDIQFLFGPTLPAQNRTLLNEAIPLDPVTKRASQQGAQFRSFYLDQLKGDFSGSDFDLVLNPELEALKALRLFSLSQNHQVQERQLTDLEARNLAFRETETRFSLPIGSTISNLEENQHRSFYGQQAYDFFKRRYLQLLMSPIDKRVPADPNLGSFKAAFESRLKRARVENLKGILRHSLKLSQSHVRIQNLQDGRVAELSAQALLEADYSFVDRNSTGASHIISLSEPISAWVSSAGQLPGDIGQLLASSNDWGVAKDLYTLPVHHPILPRFHIQLLLPEAQQLVTITEENFSDLLHDLRLPHSEDLHQGPAWLKRYVIEASMRDKMLADFAAFISEENDVRLEDLELRLRRRVKEIQTPRSVTLNTLTELIQIDGAALFDNSPLNNVKWSGLALHPKYWRVRDAAAKALPFELQKGSFSFQAAQSHRYEVPEEGGQPQFYLQHGLRRSYKEFQLTWAEWQERHRHFNRRSSNIKKASVYAAKYAGFFLLSSLLFNQVTSFRPEQAVADTAEDMGSQVAQAMSRYAAKASQVVSQTYKSVFGESETETSSGPGSGTDGLWTGGSSKKKEPSKSQGQGSRQASNQEDAPLSMNSSYGRKNHPTRGQKGSGEEPEKAPPAFELKLLSQQSGLPRYFNLVQRENFSSFQLALDFPNREVGDEPFKVREVTLPPPVAWSELSSADGDLAAKSMRPSVVENGRIPLVVPSAYRIKSLDLMTVSGRHLRAKADFKVYEIPQNGLIYADVGSQFKDGEPFHYIATYQARGVGEIKQDPHWKNLDKYIMERVVHELRESGMRQLSRALKRELDKADPLSIEKVNEIFSTTGYYTYLPEGDVDPAVDNTFFADYSRFVISGTLYYQCSASNDLEKDLLNRYVNSQSRLWAPTVFTPFEVQSVMTIYRREDELTLSGPNHLHNVVVQPWQSDTYLELDATPLKMDPRNPKKSSHPFAESSTQAPQIPPLKSEDIEIPGILPARPQIRRPILMPILSDGNKQPDETSAPGDSDGTKQSRKEFVIPPQVVRLDQLKQSAVQVLGEVTKASPEIQRLSHTPEFAPFAITQFATVLRRYALAEITPSVALEDLVALRLRLGSSRVQRSFETERLLQTEVGRLLIQHQTAEFAIVGLLEDMQGDWDRMIQNALHGTSRAEATPYGFLLDESLQQPFHQMIQHMRRVDWASVAASSQSQRLECSNMF